MIALIKDFLIKDFKGPLELEFNNEIPTPLLNSNLEDIWHERLDIGRTMHI